MVDKRQVTRWKSMVENALHAIDNMDICGPDSEEYYRKASTILSNLITELRQVDARHELPNEKSEPYT